MSDTSISPAELVRQSAATARSLADTARLHKEPHVADRFERLAAEGEARAHFLDQIVRIRELRHEARQAEERRLIAEHEAAMRALEEGSRFGQARPSRRPPRARPRGLDA